MATKADRRGTEGLANHVSKVSVRIREMLVNNWYLGFVAFGGPPAHFQIFHKQFVEKRKWIDEQMYQELFAICQALPGPGSTKMHFAINTIHGGVLLGLLSFLLWSLPGAIGMYGLAVGIGSINATLPRPVYALLTGLNAATVGIIALAAVQLAQKAISDKLTRIIVFFTGAAGMLYTALWYFPVLLVITGFSTLIWDYRLPHQAITRFTRRQDTPAADIHLENQHAAESGVHNALDNSPGSGSITVASNRSLVLGIPPTRVQNTSENNFAAQDISTATSVIPQSAPMHVVSLRNGILVFLVFVAFLITIMVIRGSLHPLPLPMAVFANILLAGTIIFGGGPVVIPLLSEYVVSEGWVSPRNFLLGLAFIQAFPGPNFNFAVYLGALALTNLNEHPASVSGIAGAVLGFIGIFLPGIVVAAATMGLWRELRTKRWLKSLLRGVNAGAVGLVFTAVYRLWQIGYLNIGHEAGSSLGSDPWFVVITATSYVGGMWFRLNAPSTILLGGVMGMIWYGVVK